MAWLYEVSDAETTEYFRRRREAMEAAEEVYHLHDQTAAVYVDKVKVGKLNMNLLMDILNSKGFVIERIKIKVMEPKKFPSFES